MRPTDFSHMRMPMAVSANPGKSEDSREIGRREVIVDDIVENRVDVDAGALRDQPAQQRVEQQDDADDGEHRPALDAEARQQPLEPGRDALTHERCNLALQTPIEPRIVAEALE